MPEPVGPSAIDRWERARLASQRNDGTAEPVAGPSPPRTVDDALAYLADHPVTLCPAALEAARAPPPEPLKGIPKVAAPHGYEADGKTAIRDPADNNPHFPTK